jgi:hypothetical protein
MSWFWNQPMGIVLERFHGWWVLSRHELNETGRSRSAFDLDDKNSEINREFFEFDPEIAQFCPKYASCVLGTGN